MIIRKPPLDPPVANEVPQADVLTGYDQEHLVTYLRLLDADAEGADWTEVARMVLHIDPSQEPERARRAWESHLKRAKWMTEHGYRHLLLGGAPH
jgi:T6SS, Transcription factor, DNA binding domain